MRPQREILFLILATYPLELVQAESLTIENPKMGKDVNVLVITDHFTRYTQVLVATSQIAQCTAKVLWNNYITHYGLLLAIISNQGRDFKSNLIQEMCDLAQVCKLCTTLYHPQRNGQCECFNLCFNLYHRHLGSQRQGPLEAICSNIVICL